MRGIKFGYLIVFFCCAIGSDSGLAQEAASASSDIARLRAKRAAAIASLGKDAKNLKELYLGKLSEIQNASMKAGNLEQTLAAEKEVKAILKGTTTDVSEFKDVQAVQSIFLAEKDRLRAKILPEVVKVVSAYQSELKKRQSELTKAEKIEEAIIILEETKSVQKLIDNPQSIGETLGIPFLSETERKTRIVDDQKSVSKMPTSAKEGTTDPFRNEFWFVDAKFGPGVFRGGDPKMIQIKVEEKGDAKPKIEFLPKTEVTDAEILVDEGELKISECHFSNTKLYVDLGGRFIAEDSLFYKSPIRKGGFWFSKIWSSRWELRNSVFAEGFFYRWSTKMVGMNVENCTIYDWEADPIEYLAEASDEAASNDFYMKDCRFVNCTLPVSAVIATEDCYFENCKFKDDGEGIVNTKQIKTKVHVNNAKDHAPKSTNSRLQFDVIESDFSDAGATLPHIYDGQQLTFKE